MIVVIYTFIYIYYGTSLTSHSSDFHFGVLVRSLLIRFSLDFSVES